MKMNNLDRDRIDLGRGNIASTFAHILFPTLIGMLFSVIFILTDGIFVGHGVGSGGLAAINLVQPVFTIATAIGMMFAVGASVVAAIHLSKDNIKAARIIITQAFLAVLVAGIILGAILYCFETPILRLLGTSDALMPLCKDYFFWFVPTILFIMIQMVGQFIIRLDGNPRFASLVEIVPACLNILLDWLFIFPFGWGLAGAAAATAIGGFVGVLMAAWYMVFRSRTLRLYKLKCTLTSIALTFRNLGYMAKVGFSAFLGEFSISVLTLVGNYSFMKMLGENGVAAFSVTCYLVPVVFMVYAAIAQSAQPIVSFNYGAGNHDRVWKAFRLAASLAVAFGLFMTVIFFLFSKQIVSVFLERSTEAYDLCAKGLPLYASGFTFMAVALTVIGFLQSVEKSLAATLLTLFRGMAFPVAAFLVLPDIFGENGLWLSIPVAEALGTLMIGVMAIFGVFRIVQSEGSH